MEMVSPGWGVVAPQRVHVFGTLKLPLVLAAQVFAVSSEGKAKRRSRVSSDGHFAGLIPSGMLWFILPGRAWFGEVDLADELLTTRVFGGIGNGGDGDGGSNVGGRSEVATEHHLHHVG